MYNKLKYIFVQGIRERQHTYIGSPYIVPVNYIYANFPRVFYGDPMHWNMCEAKMNITS